MFTAFIHFALIMMSVCRIIAAALGTRGSPERIDDLSGVYRVGSIIPEPGIRYPVYLVIRSNAQSYAEAFGALVGRQAGTPFSMLIPTGRFLTDQIEHEAQTRGVVTSARYLVAYRVGQGIAWIVQVNSNDTLPQRGRFLSEQIWTYGGGAVRLLLCGDVTNGRA